MEQRSAQTQARETGEQLRERASEMTGRNPMQQGREMLQQAEQMPANVYLGAVIGSIALSALLFMLGRRDLGIFVGLWPPTILSLALVTKALQPSREASRMT